MPDAAMTSDAGASPDAGMTTPEMPSNCGCSAPGGRTSSAASLAALLGLALALSRRRR
jgi:MYXO-CTERM domain-containing protein